LLKDYAITAPNQVWSRDITYIRLSQGFIYLVAIIDWFSRYVLAWQVSNTMDVQFCLDTLETALQTGQPHIFNSDQGSQFTSHVFTQRLERAGIQIRQDGKGRAYDNIFVERVAQCEIRGGLSQSLCLCPRGDPESGCLFPVLQSPTLASILGLSTPILDPFPLNYEVSV
jgi:Integrase core domain